MCSPYGEYELDLDVESFDDEGTTRWTRIAYEIENGEDEVLVYIIYIFFHVCLGFLLAIWL